MIDWPDKVLSVKGLLLDPENPRIPGAFALTNQKDLIGELVENDKVYDLARDITAQGYFPVESLIILRTDSSHKYLVLEGNRRLAAVKCILDPALAPEKYVQRFRRLNSRADTDGIRRVKTVLAPSREAAAPIIMAKHTGDGIQKWAPFMQAKFYGGLRESGVPLDDIASEHNMAPGEVARLVRNYKLYRLACSLPGLSPEVKEIVLDPRRFSLSTLDRILTVGVTREFLGLQITSDTIAINVDRSEFETAFGRIITDIAREAVSSRKQNKTTDIKDYISGLTDVRPSTAIDAPINLGENDNQEGEPESRENDSPKPKLRKSRKKRNPPNPIPQDFECTTSAAKIRNLFNEMRSLNITTHANAFGILLRCLLDMSLNNFMDQTGDLAEIMKRKRTRDSKKPYTKLEPTLCDMLGYIVECETNGVTRNPNLMQAIGLFISDKKDPIHIQKVHFFVHNQYHEPSRDELTTLWGRLEALFRIILQDPED